MAGSMIGGLLDSGHPASAICAADPFAESLARLGQIGDIATFSDNAQAADGADVVILAVKPQVMADAARSIAAQVAAGGSLVISIAAGVTLDTLAERLGGDAAIVRCMPNTPALLRCGASGLYANENTSDGQRQHAEFILGAVGLTRWVESEQELDAITALSGSGPAYFFLLLEAMVDAGCELGLDRDVATELAQQTALGAARMARESDVDLVELRRRVTSPGGTTQAAVESFERDGLREIVASAMRAANDRAAEMASEMG